MILYFCKLYLKTMNRIFLCTHMQQQFYHLFFLNRYNCQFSQWSVHRIYGNVAQRRAIKTYKYDPSLQVIGEKDLEKTKLGYLIGLLKATLNLQLINSFDSNFYLNFIQLAYRVILISEVEFSDSSLMYNNIQGSTQVPSLILITH